MTSAGATCYVNAACIECFNPDTLVHCFIINDGSVYFSINVSEYKACAISDSGGFGCY